MCAVAEEFIRPDDAPSADEEILALEDALEDNRAAPPVYVGEDPLPPLGRSWAWNWAEDRFEVQAKGHGPQQTFGMETLTQWAVKALKTARGAHPIYPSDYGLREANRWIGKRLGPAERARLETDIHDAMTFHPRIVGIRDFEWFQDPSDELLEVAFTLVLDDDTTTDVGRFALGET